MANILQIVTTILTKNPAHVLYVQQWLMKFCPGVTLGTVDSIFVNCYNWYYYFVNTGGAPMPVFSKSGATPATQTLKNNIAGSSGVSGDIVYQFLASLFTGYSQGKLSKEFAFPRNAATTTTQDAVNAGGATQTVNFIPDQWQKTGLKLGVLSILPVLGLAAGAIGVLFLAAKKRG
jgi:hypothetical protein